MILNHVHLILSLIIISGLIGLGQGPVWEGYMTAGIILGHLALTKFKEFLVNWVNRLYVMAQFALRGGLAAEEPGPILAEARELPLPIATDRHELIFTLATFAFLVFLVYIIGRWLSPRRPKLFGPLLIYSMPFAKRLLGAGLGAINGYLIAYFVIPRLFPEPETTITIPSGLASDFLSTKLPYLAIGFMIVILVLGLKASSKS